MSQRPYTSLLLALLGLLLWGHSSLLAQAIDPGEYELSRSGRTLIAWKGERTHLNMALDPILSHVDSIASWAFAHLSPSGEITPNYTLESIVLPTHLHHIDEYAFWARALREVRIGPYLESLGYRAFCEALFTTIFLPASLRQVDAPFWGCNRLAQIEVHEESPYLTVSHGALVERAYNRLIYFPQGAVEAIYTLAPEIVTIGREAFWGQRFVERLIVPDGVLEIEAGAFAHSERLRRIDLPPSLQQIEQSALSTESLDTLVLASLTTRMLPSPQRLRPQMPPILYVPQISLDYYHEQEHWQESIRGIASLDELETLEDEEREPRGEGALFNVVGLTLYLNLPPEEATAFLFDKEGAQKAIFNKSGSYTLAPGFYLLRIGRKTYKLVLSDEPR